MIMAPCAEIPMLQKKYNSQKPKALCTREFSVASPHVALTEQLSLERPLAISRYHAP